MGISPSRLADRVLHAVAKPAGYRQPANKFRVWTMAWYCIRADVEYATDFGATGGSVFELFRTIDDFLSIDDPKHEPVPHFRGRAPIVS